MIANLLEQQRIHARIDGEHLAGGIGDLPAMGLVRVMVNEDDLDSARGIIAEWEASSPPAAKDSVERRPGAFGWFVVGVLVGAALMGLLSRARASEQNASVSKPFPGIAASA